MWKNVFIGKEIKVEFEQEPGRKIPKKLIWGGKSHQVKKILTLWEDHGFGQAPPRNPRWWQRHHRVYYHVEVESGEIFEIYWDRSSKKKPWVLTKQVK